MAVRATPPTQVPADYDRYAGDDERGYGWVVFAGALLLMLGALNFIEGLAAIGNSHFFVNNTNYVAGSLNTWGWVLCVGVVEWCVGVGVFVKNQFARWVGVIVLGLNAIVQLMMIPAYPFWSLSIFTLDILALYGLVAYGLRVSARTKHAESASPPPRRQEVFFRSRRHEPALDNPRVADDSDAGTDETTLRQTQQLMEWRRSAQRVRRAWNAWLAAESRDRGMRYAMEVERMIDVAEAGHCVSTTDPRKSGLSAR